MQRFSITAILLAWTLTIFTVNATPVFAADQSGMMETRVTAQSMEYSPSGKEVEFTGEVHVTRKDMDIWADSITVTFAADPGGTSAGAEDFDPGAIQAIVAEGDVRIERGGRVGHSRQASYDVQEGVLELSGDPVLKDGKNRIEGKVIRFYLKDNRSEVVGDSSNRVEALFFTPKGFEE